MIGIIIRDLCYLKILHQICLELQTLGVPYILYHMDCPRGEKQYNNASFVNINKSSPLVVSGARKVKKFSNDLQLFRQLLHDRVKKVVSIELNLWMSKKDMISLKNGGVKLISVQYLTDSLWSDSVRYMCLDRVYHSTTHTMKSYLRFAGIKHDSKRDKCLGSPLFDSITLTTKKDILVLLPNIRANHVKSAFSNKERFIGIIERLSHGGNLIFKSRQKQWLPDEIKRYAADIVNDGSQMYPPVSTKLFSKCHTTVLFYSSGLYEAVYAGNYVLNIPLPLKRWNWDQGKLSEYFSIKPNSLYQFDGVVESVDQDKILGNWKFEPRKINNEQRNVWIDRFIGQTSNSANLIVEDIVFGWDIK